VVLTYDFDTSSKTLNGVTPYDWTSFLKTRIEGVSERAPLDGLTRGGYKLVYTDTPDRLLQGGRDPGKIVNLSYSLGLTVGSDGVLTDVSVGHPGLQGRPDARRDGRGGQRHGLSTTTS
jgi:predicted metalloprotease with PDZ domain